MTREYGRLREFLEKLAQPQIEMTFFVIGTYVDASDGKRGVGLPPAASTDPRWWDNTRDHAQAKAWGAAGFIARDVRPGLRMVTFVRIVPDK